MSGITVVVTSIPIRTSFLRNALDSVWRQHLPAYTVVVTVDHQRQGAAANRQRGLDCVQTEWTAFLDDDDMLYPQHLHRLYDTAAETGADLVYPWFDVTGGVDPFPMHEGKAWDNANPVQFPITYLARTQALRDAGGFRKPTEGAAHADGNAQGEDWLMELALIEIGAKIVHLPERTWQWQHGPHNTSGRADRW